ncbi:hypothetical protein [Robertkochia aurantiaca]|uniref:hypothetical protein n=1 Tax=Robertkochia aurantiaca TaxID=2873700 RepID=UPI001CC98574|nr:hypothetical protein [Robertkochia sp. 3YJGBD-33]
MADLQTKSWIFLAIAFSSKIELANVKAISDAADYINHSIPTQEEMQSSINWLIDKKLITGNQNKYGLTETGKKLYSNASNKGNTIIYILNQIEKNIQNYA